MSEFQYCYWLMGVFELGNPTSFNSKQMFLVIEHLNLVTERKYNFCNWLEGFLDANGVEELNNKNLNKVLEKLRSEFLNVIDKSYPKELWNPLQAAHDGKPYVEIVKPEKPKFEAMC